MVERSVSHRRKTAHGCVTKPELTTRDICIRLTSAYSSIARIEADSGTNKQA